MKKRKVVCTGMDNRNGESETAEERDERNRDEKFGWYVDKILDLISLF